MSALRGYFLYFVNVGKCASRQAKMLCAGDFLLIFLGRGCIYTIYTRATGSQKARYEK